MYVLAFCSGSLEFKALSRFGLKPLNLKATVLPVKGYLHH